MRDQFEDRRETKSDMAPKLSRNSAAVLYGVVRGVTAIGAAMLSVMEAR